MKENNGNELKQQIIEKVAEQVKDEDLLNLNEMEKEWRQRSRRCKKCVTKT